MKVTMITIVIVTLGTCLQVKGQEELEIRGQAETIQTTALFGSTRMPSVKFVKLFTQVRSYEANRVAEEDFYLRRRRTIYQASDCPHTGTSLHGHYGGKCYDYSTLRRVLET